MVGLFCLLLLTTAVGPALGQSSPVAYFHEAAQAYVSNDLPAARRAVRAGLDADPSNERLLALRSKLRQERAPQERSDSTSTNDGDGKEGSKAGDGGGSEEGEGSGTGNKRDPQRKESGDPDSTATESGRGGGDGALPRSRRPTDSMRPGSGGRPVDTLSRRQAERLLQALGGQERRLLRQLQRRSSAHRTVEKDW